MSAPRLPGHPFDRRAAALTPGTPVVLPDGTLAYATPDRGVNREWDGTYRVCLHSDDPDAAPVVLTGWHREQLTPTS